MKVDRADFSSVTEPLEATLTFNLISSGMHKESFFAGLLVSF